MQSGLPSSSGVMEPGWHSSSTQIYFQMSPRSSLQAAPATPPASQRLPSHFDPSPNSSVAPDLTEGFLELPSDCMDVCSAHSPGGSAAVGVPAGEALLEALAAGRPAAVDLVIQCSLAGSWPTGLSPEACVFAACKLQQAAVVEALLSAGAPAHFVTVRSAQLCDSVVFHAPGMRQPAKVP